MDHLFGQIAKIEDLEIWYETFGDELNPAFLLIMGGFCQGILWPTEFCEKLAKAGFYVIRYDHRDAGFSRCFDFKKTPYDLRDLARDAIGLLDYLKIRKTHVLGLSMGAPIAEILSVYYSERIITISLMSASSNFRPLNLAITGKPQEEESLSKPTDDYLKTLESFVKYPPKNDDEKLEERMVFWRLLNGSVVPLNEDLERIMHVQFLARIRHPESIVNHLFAILDSEQLIKDIPYQVKVPTLIFQGSEDPIFRKDHGEALAKAISDSKYVLVQGLGHIPNSFFSDFIIEELKAHTLSEIRWSTKWAR